MRKKDIEYIRGVSEVLAKIADESEKGVDVGHSEMLQSIGSRLLFIGTARTFVGSHTTDIVTGVKK